MHGLAVRLYRSLSPAQPSRIAFLFPLFALFPQTPRAQLVTPIPKCAVLPAPYAANSASGYALYPLKPSPYPAVSSQYAVQYRLDNGAWTSLPVFISIYGASNSSPYLSFSGYTKTTTSMSFVSVPARANALVQLRVTKLSAAPFLPTDHISIRPGRKEIPATLAADGTVKVERRLGPKFAGEQFIFWWDRDGQNNAGLQGLAFFLNPPYERPNGKTVKTVRTSSDLNGDLSGIDTLDFEGTITYSHPDSVEVPGAQAFKVPTNIRTIYFGPGSWFQGKLAFTPASGRRRIYGTGVLDASRFEFDLRKCSDPNYAEQGYAVLAALNPDGDKTLQDFDLDGIIVTDNNFYATDSFRNSTLNNVKVIGWNNNNDGLELGAGTRASNVFVRAGDDSLKLWGASDTITNATVWQNYNGGVVNLGWYKASPGDNGLVDQLYVVKTDWHAPSNPTFTADASNAVVHQNNAVIASMMVPGTRFGALHAPLFRNIFVDDTPQVFLSLKIVPPRTMNAARTSKVILTTPSVLNLNIENVFTPPSRVSNSIGFQTLPAGFTFFNQSFNQAYTLPGSITVTLTSVFVTSPNGKPVLLTNKNIDLLGGISINPSTGDSVKVQYKLDRSALPTN